MVDASTQSEDGLPPGKDGPPSDPSKSETDPVVFEENPTAGRIDAALPPMERWSASACDECHYHSRSCSTALDMKLSSFNCIRTIFAYDRFLYIL